MRLTLSLVFLLSSLIVLGNSAKGQPPPSSRSVAFSAILGSGIPTAIETATDGSILVAGMRADSSFPFTARIGEGAEPSFVVKLDPTGTRIQFATAIAGGPWGFDAFGMAIGPDGSIIVVGRANGPGAPTVNALRPAPLGSQDGFILKLTPDGAHVVFATYFGGVGFDHIHSVRVGPDGTIHLAGGTHSPDFPAESRLGLGATPNLDNGEIFYVRMAADGSRLISSTLIGGASTDWPTAMVLEASGRTVLAGWTRSRDFPTLNAPQPLSADVPDPIGRETREGFVLRLSRDAQNLEFSSYWGGSRFDHLEAVAVRQDGVLVVAGHTTSEDFPLCGSDPPRKGESDVFVSAIDPAQGRGLWSRCFGGSGYEAGPQLAVGSGEIHVSGYTLSPDVLPNAQRLFGCGRDGADTGFDGFLATFNSAGTLLKSLRIGGDKDDRALAVRVLPDGKLLLVGTTQSAIFPTGPRGFLGPRTSADSAWVMKLEDTSVRPLLYGVVSSAGLSTGPISPGEVVTLFGSSIGPDCSATFDASHERTSEVLSGVRVLFDGRPVPVLYTGKNQANAVAPFEIAGSTRIALEVDGIRSNSITRGVVPTSPEIYALDQSGRAAAINEDGAVNGVEQAAARGSIVAIFLTGGGSLDPPGRNGAIAPPQPTTRLAAPVRLSIGGMEAETVYAGPAPGLVLGVTQVNARIPLAISPGTAAVRIRIGDVESGSYRYLIVR